MKKTLKILLIPDFFDWALGTIAKEIAIHGKKHEYYFFSTQMINYYSQQWLEISQSVDVIHILSSIDAGKIKLPKNTCKISSIHHVTNKNNLKRVNYLFDLNDAIITPAKEWKCFFEEQPKQPKQLFLSNYGVNVKKYYPFKNRHEARKKIGVYSDSILIGYSGKYTSNEGGRKGIDIFVKALHKVVQLNHKFGLIITGPGWEKMIEELKSCGISEIYYFPFLPDELMPFYYNSIDLYVITSKVEGGPLPLLYNMACGTPIISTPVGMAKDYIENEINGLTIPKNDWDATASAMISLLNDAPLRDYLAQSAINTVQEHLTWEKVLEDLENIYSDVWEEQNNGEIKPLKNLTISSKQRETALRMDSFLWHLKLLYKGYLWSGLRGIVFNPPTFILSNIVLTLPGILTQLKNKITQRN